MSIVGQLVYNLDDYYEGSPTTSDELVEDGAIYKNLVQIVGCSSFTRVGIQAPPGTRAILNNKEILIGQNGIFELDEDLAITSLSFVKQPKYEKEDKETVDALIKGINGINDAEKKRKDALAELGDFPKDGTEENQKEYTNAYNKIQADYDKEYQTALNFYNLGVNGIYKEAGNITLKNIIIDYVGEGGGSV